MFIIIQGELLKPVKGKGVSFAEPKLLDASIPEDMSISEALKEFREDLKEYQKPIGITIKNLERHENTETNIGNLVTDSVRKCYWNDVTIAFQNNGGIRY